MKIIIFILVLILIPSYLSALFNSNHEFSIYINSGFKYNETPPLLLSVGYEYTFLKGLITLGIENEFWQNVLQNSGYILIQPLILPFFIFDSENQNKNGPLLIYGRIFQFLEVKYGIGYKYDFDNNWIFRQIVSLHITLSLAEIFMSQNDVLKNIYLKPGCKLDFLNTNFVIKPEFTISFTFDFDDSDSSRKRVGRPNS